MRRFVTSIAIAVVLVQLFAMFSAYEHATFDALDSFAAREVMPVFARARFAQLLQSGAFVAGTVALVVYLRTRKRHRSAPRRQGREQGCGPRERLVVRCLVYGGLAYLVAAGFGNPWLQVVAELVALSVPLTAIAAASARDTLEPGAMVDSARG